jgi:hypothetical protein
MKILKGDSSSILKILLEHSDYKKKITKVMINDKKDESFNMLDEYNRFQLTKKK